MDSNDLERERASPFWARTRPFLYPDVKINIVDTPGQVDLAGSERA